MDLVKLTFDESLIEKFLDEQDLGWSGINIEGREDAKEFLKKFIVMLENSDQILEIRLF